MKLLYIFIFLITFPAFAKINQFGLGVMIGNPTGLSGKYWLNKREALDGGLAYSLGKHTNLSLHSDYLLHKFQAFYLNDVHPLDFYYGIGGRMEFADDVELGVRVPFGLVHRIEQNKADIFAEVAPIVDLFARTGLELHFGIGARYYF